MVTAQTIVTPPTNLLVTAGQSATFTVGATGPGTLSYQWRRNGFLIPGATGSSFTLANASRTDADYYDVVVSAGLNSVTSPVARLSVAPTSYPTSIAPDPKWNLQLEALGGYGTAVAPLSDGRTYIAGTFTNLNGTRCMGLARVNADGATLDSTFQLPYIDSPVNLLAVQADGKILIAGEFQRVNGLLRPHLARLNPDGSVDASFTLNDASNIFVKALVGQPDGCIVVGGGYHIGKQGMANYFVARLKSDGSLDPSFRSLGVDDLINTLSLQSDGRLLVGGRFIHYVDSNGVFANRSHLIRLNRDGTLDTTFSVMAPDFVVKTLTLQADGKFVAGGEYNPPAKSIARFNVDGSQDPTFTGRSDLSFNALVVQPDGKIMAITAFHTANPADGWTEGLSRLNDDGSLDATFPVWRVSPVVDIALQANGQLLAAGYFSGYYDSKNKLISHFGFARIDPDGRLDAGFNFSFRTEKSVECLLPLQGGKMLVAGGFEFVRGKSSAARLIRLNADATVDLTFNPGGIGPDSIVHAACAQPDGKILIAGLFSTYNGIAVHGIARLNTDGTLDETFRPGQGIDDGHVIAVLPGGRVFVGGGFLHSIGVPLNSMAVFGADGALDPTFGASKGGNPGARALTSIVQPDGKIIIGGWIWSYDGVPVGGIVRLKPDGTLDSTFATGRGFDGGVFNIALQTDGKILACGNFSSFNGTTRLSVARLNQDGTLDLTFVPPFSLPDYNSATGLLLQDDGRVIVRGSFTAIAVGSKPSYLMRLNSDGTRDPTFNTGGFIGSSWDPSWLIMRDDGQLAMPSGGTACFSVSQNSSLPLIISAPSDQSTTVGSTATFTVTASSVLPLTYQWLFNGAPVAGATQASLSLTNVQTGQAGSYSVVVTNELGTTTSAVVTLTLAKVPAVVALGHLAQTYDGTPHPINVSTVPTGLPVTVTYDGSTTVPTQAGTYAVAAGVIDPSYEGSTVGTLTIAKATATVSVAAQTVVYNGIQRPATATASPAGLYLTFTYNGSALPPTNAGSYAVSVSVEDPNYTGTGSGTLTITPASATLVLGSLSATYDGTPKSVTAVTSPSGLAVALIYNGSPAAPSKAGSYSVTASIIDSNYAGSASGTLTIAKATATVTLQGLNAIYDGSPLPVTVSTAPVGLVAHVTYNGSDTPPTYPGTYAVAATVDESSYTGSASGTLFVTAGAMVRHAPILNGGLDGSLQMLLPEDVSLDGVSWISGDFLVPGEPTVSESGNPIYVGVREASGSATPTTHQIALNDGATLRYLVRRVDALAMPAASTPPAPTGTRNLVIASANPNVGNVSLLRNITLIGAGQLALPGGTYGVFSARGTSKLTLGIAGATSPTVYNLQGLALTEHSQLILLGPVVINLASAPSIQISAGTEVFPDWLMLNIASGDLLLTGDLVVSGFIVAPTSVVTIASGAMVYGGLASDRLILDDGYLVFPSE